MGFLEERDLSDVPSIPDYYKGKTIFITGGSGFMGKVLIEKLLYSCPDLERIYLLLRSKKGVKPKDRLRELYNSHCFDRLRKEKPDIFEKKVFFISGDCSEIGLGISDEDRTLILNTTQIIFHGAASVRFDDSLKVAANLNLRGTIEMVELAKNVKNLEVFVHISTSYANANRRRIDEVVYPAFADWRDTLEICEKCDENTLKILTPKYLGELPNTYVFTKQLAEHVLWEQKGKLPIIIMRPTIVVSSVSEPVVGWVENLNGPVGILIASGKGIMQSMYLRDQDLVVDYLPVDIAIKIFIAGGWMRGTKKSFKASAKQYGRRKVSGSIDNLFFTILSTTYVKISHEKICEVSNVCMYLDHLTPGNWPFDQASRLEPTDDIEVYNCSTSNIKSLTFANILDYGKIIVQETPIEGMLWYPNFTIASSRLRYELNVIFFHLLPAILVDIILRMSGRNPMLVKVQRRIYSATLALQYFTSHEWVFTNANILELREKIKDLDKNNFYYDMENVDQLEFFKNSTCAAKKYLLKEKIEDLPKVRAHMKRMQILDFVVRAAFYVFVLWFLINTEYVRGILKSCVDLLF